MPSSSPRCPGANVIAGPPINGPSVICGPLALDRDREGQGKDKGSADGVMFTSRQDPSTFFGRCCGDYTKCLIWQAEYERLAAEKTDGALVDNDQTLGPAIA